MTLPLRQRHRRIFAVLTVFVPLVFVFGIAARRPVPNVRALPKEIAGAHIEFRSVVWQRRDLFPKTGFEVRLLRESHTAGENGIALSAPRDFAKPDLIVYWVPGASRALETLPENALLLGAFNGQTTLPIPAQALVQPGVLVLYSLPNGEIADCSKPFRFDDSTH